MTGTRPTAGLVSNMLRHDLAWVLVVSTYLRHALICLKIFETRSAELRQGEVYACVDGRLIRQPGPGLSSVNYFCRSATTIFAGIVHVDPSTATMCAGGCRRGPGRGPAVVVVVPVPAAADVAQMPWPASINRLSSCASWLSQPGSSPRQTPSPPSDAPAGRWRPLSPSCSGRCDPTR